MCCRTQEPKRIGDIEHYGRNMPDEEAGKLAGEQGAILSNHDPEVPSVAPASA